MGRAERRMFERSSSYNDKQNQILLAMAKAQANRKRLSDSEVKTIQQGLTDVNLSCIYAAFSMALTDFGLGPKDINALFLQVDDLVSKVGTTEEYPTVSDFKIKSALATGIGIQLTEEEQKEVDRIYNEYYPEEE